MEADVRGRCALFRNAHAHTVCVCVYVLQIPDVEFEREIVQRLTTAHEAEVVCRLACCCNCRVPFTPARAPAGEVAIYCGGIECSTSKHQFGTAGANCKGIVTVLTV